MSKNQRLREEVEAGQFLTFSDGKQAIVAVMDLNEVRGRPPVRQSGSDPYRLIVLGKKTILMYMRVAEKGSYAWFRFDLDKDGDRGVLLPLYHRMGKGGQQPFSCDFRGQSYIAQDIGAAEAELVSGDDDKSFVVHSGTVKYLLLWEDDRAVLKTWPLEGGANETLFTGVKIDDVESYVEIGD